VLRRVPALDPDTRANGPIVSGPIADGVILANERTSFDAGTARAVPTILGNNAAEGMFFAPNVPVTTLDQYRAALQKRFGNAAAEAATLWPAATDAEAHVAESLIVGDLEINASARRLARILAARGVPVYRYVLTKERAGKLPGHTEEQPYVWDAPAVTGLGQPAPPFDAGDQRVSELMLGAWTQFAKTGNPNGPGLAPWPRYDAQADRFVVFADPPTTGTSFRTAQLDFIARTLGR
jgi:para-nitrobenzyl esterase